MSNKPHRVPSSKNRHMKRHVKLHLPRAGHPTGATGKEVESEQFCFTISSHVTGYDPAYKILALFLILQKQGLDFRAENLQFHRAFHASREDTPTPFCSAHAGSRWSVDLTELHISAILYPVTKIPNITKQSA